MDVVLSKNSPLGIRFNYLKGTSSDKENYPESPKENPAAHAQKNISYQIRSLLLNQYALHRVLIIRRK